MSKRVISKTGLRPVGSVSPRVFHVGQSTDAVRFAEIGDELAFELIRNMSDEGLDRFSGALARKGLEFGELTTVGPQTTSEQYYILYPLGRPDWEF